MIAAPVAEAAAGRAAAGTAAKKAGTRKAAAKKAAKKPAAAGPAGGPPPPPEQAAGNGASGNVLDSLKPPGTDQAKQLGSSAVDALKSATLTPPKSLNARDASGFAFGLVLYAVALASIKYGPAGARGWIAAKFLNKPMTK